MKIPNKIRIAGVDYSVKYDSPVFINQRQCMGSINYDHAIIKIDPDVQSKETQPITLLHEIFHGIARHFDLQFEDEEDVVDKFAKGLYMVIADNPDMFN